RRRHGRRARDGRRGADRGNVPGRNEARHYPSSDPLIPEHERPAPSGSSLVGGDALGGVAQVGPLPPCPPPVQRAQGPSAPLAESLSPSQTSSSAHQAGFAAPLVHAERRSAASLAHSFITFSASPHSHCAAVEMLPPPMRRSTPATRTSPVTESVSLNSACAPPTNGYEPVAPFLTVLKSRACGITIVMVRRPGVAAARSVTATWGFMTSGPSWSTTWNCLDSSWSRAVYRKFTSLCWSSGETFEFASPQNVTG